MNGSKRRINSTGRRRIPHRCIDVVMPDGLADEPLMANISLDLRDQGFPGSASVVFEAYRRSSGMRFDLGTIDAPCIPDPIILDKIDRSGSVLFRLKVVDSQTESGLLIGSAERIRPKGEGKDERRRSLLPVRYSDMQSDVWKVEIEHGDRPILFINKRIPEVRNKLQTDPVMQGVLLPAAFRFVLQELVRLTDSEAYDDDQSDWKKDWLEFCRISFGIQDDPRDFDNDTEKRDWIDNVVQQFCSDKNFMRKIQQTLEDT